MWLATSCCIMTLGCLIGCSGGNTTFCRSNNIALVAGCFLAIAREIVRVAPAVSWHKNVRSAVRCNLLRPALCMFVHITLCLCQVFTIDFEQRMD